jgi:LPS O-antigen subunit length determinant protein (WzzB/FepE family)
LKDRALAVMRSRSFTDRFLRENGLLPVLFAPRWDASRKDWVGPPPTADEAYEEFDRRVRFIAEDRKAGFVRVAMRARDPENAAKWAAVFVAQLNAHMRAQAASEATRNLEFLNKELSQTTIVGVQQSLYRLIEAQVRNKMLASVREEYAFRVIDPAVVPAPDRYVSPRRMLILALATFAGLVLALVVAVVRETSRKPDSN